MSDWILHIETATRVCSVALSKDGHLIGKVEVNDENYAHGENLNLFIIQLLADCELDKRELSAISISSGPGSYTGLRIGAATAKALCYALHIPLIAVDTLESLKEVARAKYTNGTICSAIDARRMEIYSSIYDENDTLVKPISADIIEQDSYSEFDPFVCVGDGADKLKEIWSQRDLKIDGDIVCSASGQVSLAYQKLLSSDFVDVAYWEPFYLKDFVAGIPKSK